MIQLPEPKKERRKTMPVQRFAPMTKDFATFDCDAHVTEPPLIWERAAEFLTADELAALKSTIWWDEESRQLIVHGRAGVGIGSPRRGGIPGTMRVISNAGPGVKHDIQRALNVRNLNAKTALTQDQVTYIDFAGSYEPEPRLRDMDAQGIDQVMIIPTDIDTYPWLLDAVGGKAFCKAYNQWAYEYTRADPDEVRHLVARGEATAMRRQFIRPRRHTGFWYDEGRQQLTLRHVRHANDTRERHGVMTHQHILHLRR
jgi:hypothetical protein